LDQTTAGQALLDLVESAVADHCDELDGVKDGLIENPLKCDFDITTLACDPTAPSQNSTNNCLSASQIAAFQKIYAGPHNSTGHSLYPGFSFGSENEILPQTSGSLSGSFTASILQNVVFDNLTYDVDTFDWDADVALIDQRAGTLIDEISPDLSAFRARGGKLLVTQGWADPYNAATWPIDHMKQMEDAMGGNVSDWFSLFMLPGTFSISFYYGHFSSPFYLLQGTFSPLE
jgi:feruloyl esterase